MTATAVAGAQHAVDVWTLALHAQACDLAHLLQWLDHDERQRALRFVQEADRRRFVVARAALRRLIGRRLALAPQQVVFTANAFGKPLLPAPQALHFNVSHAGAWIVLALSTDAAVGVDVEVLQTEATQAALAVNALSPAERTWLAGLASDQRGPAFTHLWVCKEAYAKARGEGLSRDFSRICVGDAASAAPSILHDHNPGGSAGGCSLRRFDLPGHAACLAYLGAPPIVRVHAQLDIE